MGTTQTKNIGSIIPHQRFTTSQFLSKQNVIVARVNITKQSVIKQWSEELNAFRTQNPQSNKFLLLPLQYQLQDAKFCTFASNLKMQFQNFPYVLQEEITNRTTLNRNFQEEQMWLLFYTLLAAHNMFSKKNKKVGDIHPHNIFINQQGYPNIASQLSWPQQATNFQKLYYEKNIRYLSPQQMQCCKQGLSFNSTNPQVSQSFSIGLTMLHAGILKDLSPLYNLNSYELNQNYLDSNIQKWMNLKFNSQKNFSINSYSPLLKNMIKNLCKVNPQERESALSLYNTLRVYQDKILNLELFTFNEVPSTIFGNNNQMPFSNKIQFQLPKVSNLQQKKIIQNDQNMSVKFNYKSNLNSPQQQRRYIPLGKPTNAGIQEYQKSFFMNYANLHHGEKMQKPHETQKLVVNPSEIKQVFEHYADHHKHDWNSNQQYSHFALENKTYNSNLPNSLYTNTQNQVINTNNGRETGIQSASDIMKRIDEQILKSKKQFS